MKLFISGILLIHASTLLAQTQVVENVRFDQRTDGSLMVDIYYDVTAVDNDLVEIMIEASDDDGATWTLPCSSLDGDVGIRVTPGKNKHVQWNFFADNPNTSGYHYRVRVTAHGRCHLYITEDTTLDADLVLDPQTNYAIIIGAPNVTLDLGGHMISHSGGSEMATGIIAEDVEGITIRNGTLEGFLSSVGLGHTDNALIENLTIRNLMNADPDSQITGISIGRSKDVVVRDVRIEFPPVMHKEAINVGRSDITISDIEIHGGSVGVAFGGDAEYDPENNRTNGAVLNSRFFDGGVACSILVGTTTNARIAGNEFIRNECSISAYGRHPLSITGLNIDGNTIHDGVNGIDFWGVSDASITNNIIKDGGRGIRLLENMYCEFGPPEQCFYATGNVIADNVVTGHVVDLFHHEKAVGNTWLDNIFCTKDGDEIPDCNMNIKTTAREALPTVNASAAELAADAQLFFVESGTALSGQCDTTGKSCNWVYIYQSAGQQKNYRFWFKEGQIINQDSVDENFENFLPLPELWIDSDAAIVIADGQGGKEFREAFELQTIKMSLFKTAWFNWDVLYVAQDTTFSTSFDASME